MLCVLVCRCRAGNHIDSMQLSLLYMLDKKLTADHVVRDGWYSSMCTATSSTFVRILSTYSFDLLLLDLLAHRMDLSS